MMVSACDFGNRDASESYVVVAYPTYEQAHSTHREQGVGKATPAVFTRLFASVEKR
jgi:hypothetical protein